MGKITFGNGVTMTFEGNPSQSDIDEMGQVAMKRGGNNTPQGESGDDWLSKSFPKTARNNLSKLYQGGANSPANVKAQQDLGLEKMKSDLMDIPVVAVRTANARMLGAPGLIDKMAGVNMPEATSSGGKLASGLGEFAGGMRGIEGLGIPLAKQAIKGIAGGANNIKNLINPIAFAGKVRQSMFAVRAKLGQELDQSITKLSEANPDKKIDLSEHFQRMKDSFDLKDTEGNVLNPGLKGEVNRIINQVKNPEDAKFLKKLINQPEEAGNLTLKESENLKRMISQSPVVKRVLSQGRFANVSNGEREVLDLLDNVKASQAEQFDELSTIRQPYAKYMSAYNKIKNSFKEGTLLGKMRKGFGDEETMENVKTVLPKEVLDQITGFRQTGKTLKAGASVVGAGAGFYGVENLLKRIFSGK